MKIWSISIALFFAVMIVVNAQEPLSQQEYRRPVLVDDIRGERILSLRQNGFSVDSLQLNDKQREQITKFQAEIQKDLNKLNRQLREKEVQLQTLETQPVANLKAINKNIDEQAKLIARQMKLKAEYKQKIRVLLDDRQRRMFDGK